MDKPTKQMSRRDAMKLLGAAAGATVLANLPTKWNTPELTAGVLPAHAQTSGHVILLCETAPGAPVGPQSEGRLLGDGPVSIGAGGPLSTAALIDPPDLGISMHYKIVLTNLSTSDPLEGDVPTGTVPIAGVALVTIGVVIDNLSLPVVADATWTFTSPADGSGSCSAAFSASPPD
jgi:hypothetical protein